jgi:hypothetical protein
MHVLRTPVQSAPIPPPSSERARTARKNATPYAIISIALLQFVLTCNAGSSSSGQHPEEAVPGAASPKRGSTPRKSSGKAKAKKKVSVRDAYRMPQDEIPEGWEGTIVSTCWSVIFSSHIVHQRALRLQIRIMWNMISRRALPSIPPEDMLVAFGSRFTSTTQLWTARTDRASIQSPASVRLVHAISYTNPGTYARDAALVEESVLSLIGAICARYGITEWAPDLRDTAYSIYNSACRIIFLESFKQALIARGFDFLNANPAHARETLMIMRCYDHFVHFIQFVRFRRDQANPGCVISAEEDKVDRERRRRVRPACFNGGAILLLIWLAQLALARMETAAALKLPQRVLDVIDPKACSDDELDEASGKYIMKAKEGRSPWVEQLFRELDSAGLWLKSFERKPTRKVERVMPAIPQPSRFPALPHGVPVDYLTPEFFNILPSKNQWQVMGGEPATIALPQEPVNVRNKHDPILKLSDRRFMATYGDAILEQYDLPDSDDESSNSKRPAREVARAREVDENGDEDMEEGDEDAQVSEEELEAQRASIVQNLALDVTVV